MSNVTSVLATRARQYLDDNLSSERDIRLIFPGLTRSLAVELHRVIGAALGDGDVLRLQFGAAALVVRGHSEERHGELFG